MDIEKAIEISELKNEIASYCKTISGKELVNKIRFLTDFSKINKLLSQTEEMKDILLSLKSFPSDNYFDIKAIISSLRADNACISQDSMKLFLLSYSTIRDILSYFSNSEQDKYTYLKSLTENIVFNEELLKECDRIIDVDGNIKDSCSKLLQSIREEKNRKEKAIERKIQSILLSSKANGYTNEEDDITIRNDRVVIPVKATYKKQVKGILHDTSQSGQTFFIEPNEIVELNFDIKELDIKQEKEIHRILLEFTDIIRENVDDLIKCYSFLCVIDFIKAKAEYAIKINANKPIFNKTPKLLWHQARHPFLEQALKKNGKQITPLKIELNEKDRILIISGPNAGGKSVCLKTVALLQYMLQCGLLVPMKQISETGIFDEIFISIGDEQSLENDLSTYSSHLLNMKNLCEKADKDSLFLIDECGTGTDPTIGGAIAESILEYLNSIHCYGVVTTHYSNLKHLALEYDNIVNGAMLFDTEKMIPLYTLTIGTPGSSFAFEIAQKIGLNKSIIDKAKSKIGQTNIKFEQQLQQIEVEKIELEKKNVLMKQYDDTLFETINKYNALNDKLISDKSKILNQARNQAKEILENANKKIEKTIEEIRTSKADKEQVKDIKIEVKKEIEKIEKEIEENSVVEKEKGQEKDKKTNLKILSTPIVENDLVVVGSEQTVFEVVKVRKDKLEIENNGVRLIISKNKVKKIDKKSYNKQLRGNKKNNEYSSNPIMDRINDIRIHFNPQIDLRGKRTEDAIKEVSYHIDQARLLGEREISILHGKGDGILKTMIRDFLRNNREVKSYRAEKVEFGGEGITIVELN